jgi:hypothetical protein
MYSDVLALAHRLESERVALSSRCTGLETRASLHALSHEQAQRDALELAALRATVASLQASASGYTAAVLAKAGMDKELARLRGEAAQGRAVSGEKQGLQEALAAVRVELAAAQASAAAATLRATQEEARCDKAILERAAAEEALRDENARLR